MKSLKFTLPLLLAVSIVFSVQNFTDNRGIDAAGQDREELFSGSRLAGEYISAPTSTPPTLVPDPRPENSDGDPYYKHQWGLKAIEFPSGSDLPLSPRREVRVAVLDTGIDGAQEDLQGKVVSRINFTRSPSAEDINGHGTHVSGIIAAEVNNNQGITGIAPFSRLLSVKVAGDSGKSEVKDLVRGIRWAADNGASVINISIELPEPSAEMEEAVNYAWEKGSVIVAAASNQTVAPVYPAYYVNCIAVAGIDRDGFVGPLLYDNEWVDVAAPGFYIYSTLPGNNYGYKSGTSFASAHVSGLAAMLCSIASDSNGNGKVNDEVRAAIETAARSTSENRIKVIQAASAVNQIHRSPDSLN